MLDKEFKYYLKHQEDLLPKYNGKYVMIVGNNVVGACGTISEAYYKGKREFGLGNFLVQLCTPGDSAYTVTYHTPVSYTHLKLTDTNHYLTLTLTLTLTGLIINC